MLRDYVCTVCNETKERLVTSATEESQYCEVHPEHKLERSTQLHASNLRFKGNWSGTTGSF